jgi:hypothetical protein
MSAEKSQIQQKAPGSLRLTPPGGSKLTPSFTLSGF